MTCIAFNRNSFESYLWEEPYCFSTLYFCSISYFENNTVIYIYHVNQFKCLQCR